MRESIIACLGAVALASVLAGCTDQPDGNEQGNGEDLRAVQPAVSACLAAPSRETCDGVDPEKSGCAPDEEYEGQYTKVLGSLGVEWGTLYQRYSKLCRTRWTTYVSSETRSVVRITRITPELTLDDPPDGTQHHGTLNYTDMVYAPEPTSDNPNPHDGVWSAVWVYDGPKRVLGPVK